MPDTMNALSHDFTSRLSGPLVGREGGPAVSLEEQWSAVHQAGRAAAQLAQLGEEELGADIAQLPDRAGELDVTRQALVADAVEDVAALMQPGLRALSALAEQGRDTTAAALQLWREYYDARSAIVALAATD